MIDVCMFLMGRLCLNTLELFELINFLKYIKLRLNYDANVYILFVSKLDFKNDLYVVCI